MHNIWIATDLHLYNVENDPHHPFRTQRNLGNLADNYGSDIQDDDLLIFLGDLYDPATGDAEKVSSIIHNIKGTKIMCRGNHDTESKDFYRELGFDAVCDILRIHNLIFSHKPVRVNPDELNIHGHLHSEKLSSLGYQHINAYPINHNKEDQPVLIEDLIDSAIVQNRDEVHGPSFNQQQMDAFTSLVSNETYHDVLDLSDEFTMSPMDEAATAKRKKTEAEKLYFLSEHDDWDESIIKPRIPNNFLTQRGYEDATIPRVCFSTFIDGCLRALSQNLKGKVFYVYQPVGKYEVITPTLEQVPDRAVTRERWITKPVELHCIGKIQVGEAKGDGIKYVYGEDNEHSAKLYDWEWEWIEKIDESVQPSIVSLSATSKKDPRLKRDIMDEILFPDVDSTRFFEADDNAPEAEADQKKTHKMLDKNDVAADGQTTLDESSYKKKKKKKVKTPEMVFTFIKPGERETTETISILAQDLFHEKIMIHPERIDVQKIATMERVGELIEYFERTAEGEAIDKYGVTSDHYIAGSFLLNAYRDKPEHKEIEDILIPDLPPEEFKQYVKDTIEYLNQVESAICGLICANMAMIRLSIDDVCAECLTPYGRNKVIEEAKQLVDDYEKDIKSTYKYYANSPYTGDVEEFKTIVFDYGPVGLRKKVVISGMMYDNKVYKNLMKPSRYLVRFGVYDVVIVVHGRTTFTENGGYRWDIEPLQVDKGVTVTDMNSAIQYFRNKYHGRILVTSCNEAGIVPDDKLYDMVDFASHTVLFESTDVGLPATVGSTSSMLKSLINYVPKKIKALNRTEARIVTALDEFNFLATPTEFDYINVDEKLGHVTVSIKSKKIKGPKDFRVEMGSSLNELFMYYEKVLYRFMMFGKLIQQHMSGVIVENGYTWNIQGINLKALTPSFDAVNQDLFVYDDMPSLGYRYTDIDEYANDIELFRATNAWFYGDITLQSDSINEDTYDAWKDIYYKITNPMTINIANVSETPDVLFTKVITPESLVKIFQLAYMPAIPDGWKTMVKISTGEPGGHNYLKPELIGELVKLVHGTICDTVTAYEGGRDTKEGQLKTMKDHGFTEIGDVDVLDGDGELVIPVKNGYMLQDVNAGKNILGYDFHIVLTHFKGHPMAGFGGSIKNVAIGCASRRGKSQIHTYGSTAEMTVGFLDQYDQQSFLKAMVDAAKSFVDVMKITGPILYINIANNLSVDCDCIPNPVDPTMADIGIFASWDPVAVDSACIDAVYYAKDSKNLVERIESKDGTDILEYAQEAGMGSRSYHLIDIDKINRPMSEAATKKDEKIGTLNVNGEELTIYRKTTENPNDPVGKEAHDLAFYLDGKKLADISISAVDSNKAFLYNFEVSNSQRGKGYGTAILKWIMKNYKVNELTVDKTNTKAIKLYERFGFKKGVEFKEDGKTRVDMKINLNESTYVSKSQFNGYNETLYHLDAFRKAYQTSGRTTHGIPDDVDTVCTFFEDILDNYNQIAPETLDRDKVAACKSADDLIALFYDRAQQFGDDLSSEYTSSLEVLHHLINLKKNPKNNVRFDEVVPTNLSKNKFAAFIAKRIQEMDDIEAFLTNALKSNLQMYGIIRKEIQTLESDSTNKDHVKALKAYMDKHEDDFIHVSKKGDVKTYEYDFGSFGRGKAYIDSTIYETSHDIVKPTRLLVRATMYDYIIYSHGIDSETEYAMSDIVIDGHVFNNVSDIVTYLQNGTPKRILIMTCNNNQVVYDSNDLRFANVKYPSREIVMESALAIRSDNPNKMLKEWESYLDHRLGTINRVHKHLVHQISDDEFVLYPSKCKLLFAKSSAKNNKLVYQESFDISNRNMFVNAIISSIESIIRLYEQVCFTCKMMVHIIHDAYNDSLTESGYGWEIKPVTGMSWSPDDYLFGYRYHIMQECFHDLTLCHELFFESSGCCGRIYNAENPKYWSFTNKTLEPAILEAHHKYSEHELQEAINQFTHIQNEAKEYLRTDDIHPIDREEKKNIAEKYGLRAVEQELPDELREKEKTPEERYKELHEKRVKSLKKARKVKKRKAFTRKVKSHLPGVKNEDVELFYEDAEAVDNSDDSTPDGVEHSPLYGDKKDFFYNYDYPKDANSYAERLKLEESATKQEGEEPLTKQELTSLGIRDLNTLQRWMKNNIRYKNFTQLMTPREVLKEKKGSCHDQVVFEMAALKALGYSPTAYFVLEHDDKPNNSQGGETHSYVVVKDNGRLYWLENAWEQYAGVNEITNPKFIRQAHKERAWGDSNKFKQLEVVRFAGQPGDSLQQLVDHCFNDKQEIDKPKKKGSIVETGTPIWETYQFELEESIQFLDRMDEAATTKNQKLYPVYIMLVHSGTTVSNAIKVVSHAEFSHAAISFDSSMDEMYSFARKDPRNPFIGGFRFESVGRGFYDNKHCPYAVYVVPCTETQIKKMKKRLNYFIQNQSKFKFDFVGLVKNYLGIVDNPEYRWFCSRFVADILNAGAPKKNPYVEEPSLQDPDDFKNTDYATYVIGGSDLMKYDQKLVDKRTKQILREEEMSRKVQNESVTYDLDRDNPFGDLVLGYQFAMMDESVVDRFLEYLKSFKLKFDKNGNIVIRRREYDQLDTHFRQSLKLIKAAEKAGNLDTVKYELCKIYYMISLIDRHYLGRKASDKSEKVRKDMINLRAVMINAIHQHLKYVSTMDPQFNFQSYYASTKYGDDTTISPQFLTAFGRTIVTALN